MKLKHYISLCILGLSLPLTAQKIENPINGSSKTSFAIVVDDITYKKAEKELKEYRNAIEKRGLSTYIISHDWKSPDEIKTVLQNIYQKKTKLEGTVFVGDIPVPMIRDAQHLTSTFKMDQRLNWQRSSVPSDRFYDDFDLKFNFLKQDSLQTNLYYYSLSPDSPQEIKMDIYSARIKPPSIKGKDKYEQIREFLTKAVAQSTQKEKLDNALFFTAHGYHSESLNAWGGEHIALKEQFPQLFKVGSQTKFMNFRMAEFMKFQLLSELKRDNLDMTIFHGHGDDENQLINGYPYVSNPNPSIENVKRYLRSKVQAADRKKQNVGELKSRFEKNMGVPMAWMDNALTDSVMIADSIFNANTDISIHDIKQTGPSTRFMMMDACDNGSFEEGDYIAGHYVFGKGKNVLVMANSVGVLQDQWPTEMLGLVQYGVRFGNWLKEVAYLETHLFGDPTFTFDGAHTVDLNDAMVNKTQDIKLWKKLLNDKNPDVQSLALAHIFDIQKNAASDLLKSTYFNSEEVTVRMEALKLLNKLNNADYHTVLKAAVNDPFELIRRLSASMIGDSGDDALVPALVSSVINEVNSERVSYNSRNSLQKMNPDVVLAELNKQIKNANYLTQGSELQKSITALIQSTKQKLEREFSHSTFNAKTDKEKLSNLRMLRAYNYHTVVTDIVKVAADTTQSLAVRTVALEALGWFRYSHHSNIINQLCISLLSNNKLDKDISVQALKTKQIINSIKQASAVVPNQ